MIAAVCAFQTAERNLMLPTNFFCQYQAKFRFRKCASKSFSLLITGNFIVYQLSQTIFQNLDKSKNIQK